MSKKSKDATLHYEVTHSFMPVLMPPDDPRFKVGKFLSLAGYLMLSTSPPTLDSLCMSCIVDINGQVPVVLIP